MAKRPLTTSQLRAAWGPHCQAQRGVRFTLNGGAIITVDARIVPAVRALNAILVKHDYEATGPDCGAYVCRPITGGKGYSLHAYLIAIDINWLNNPYSAANRLITDMPRAMVDEIVALRTNSGAPVWGWGGFYRSIKDTMHYEIVCTPADLASGIANPPAIDNGGFGIMTDAEIDAKFLTLHLENEKLSKEVAELKDQAKRHNKAAQERDAKILAAINALAA